MVKTASKGPAAAKGGKTEMADVLLTLEPLTYLGDDDDEDDDEGDGDGWGFGGYSRVGLAYCSEREIEREMRKVVARICGKVAHGAKGNKNRGNLIVLSNTYKPHDRVSIEHPRSQVRRAARSCPPWPTTPST